MVQNAAFRGFVPEDDGDRSGVAAMVACTPSHLALLAKVGEPTTLCGFLWDTAYGTLQSDADVGRFTGVKWSPTDSVTGAMGRGAGCAIFASTGTVVALNFPDGAAEGTLKAAVGKLGASRRVVTDAWAERSTAAVAQFATAASGLRGRAARRAEGAAETFRATADGHLDKVMDPSECATAKALDKAVEAFVEAYKSASFELVTDGGLQYHVLRILQRCLDEQRYFPMRAIERLLELKCVSLHHCPTILDVALDSARRPLLRACLIHLDGITEKVLMQCFVELHGRNKDAPAAPSDASEKPETELQEFLRLAYCRGWSEDALIAALLPLSLDGVLFLVENLRWWLAEHRDSPAVADEALAAPLVSRQRTGRKTLGPTPTQAQVLDWIAAIVDAKFSTLIHSIETHQLIREINDLLQEEHEVCEQMMGMSGLLERFINGKALPRSHAEIGPYSIELLNLSV
eukprot:m.150871 g.150871  ORF g.150871 m.150871 type:complete len:460 (-) comp11689_c1_seq3:344-1723(-)